VPPSQIPDPERHRRRGHDDDAPVRVLLHAREELAVGRPARQMLGRSIRSDVGVGLKGVRWS
jgi:hypothetical protein